MFAWTTVNIINTGKWCGGDKIVFTFILVNFIKPKVAILRIISMVETVTRNTQLLSLKIHDSQLFFIVFSLKNLGNDDCFFLNVSTINLLWKIEDLWRFSIFECFYLEIPDNSMIFLSSYRVIGVIAGCQWKRAGFIKKLNTYVVLAMI